MHAHNPSNAAWRVSAIVPVYNRANLIGETLRSILAQSLPPHEVIVVDDGSTDDTAHVIAGFGSTVRTVHLENSGAPAARNLGARLADGNWLWFCDSDDLWRPEYLERVRDVAMSPLHPEFVFGNFALVHDGVWSRQTKFDTAPADFWGRIPRKVMARDSIALEPLYAHILHFQPIFHSTIAMSRAFFERTGGYDEAFARAGSEDFEFTLRCAAQAPIGIVEEPLVGIRRHAGNFSANQLKNLLGEVVILRHAKAHHAAAAALTVQIDREIARRTTEALELAFTLRDFALVRRLAGDLAREKLGLKPRLKALIAALPLAQNPAAALSELARAQFQSRRD